MALFQKNFFGLDISDLSLKIAHACFKRGGLVIDGFSYCDLPKGVVEGGEVKNEEKLSYFIKECLEKTQGEKIKTKNVICSLPEEKSFVDVFQAPLVERKENLDQLVLTEAESRIPFPLSEVYFDFNFVKKGNLSEIVLVACPKKIIDSYFNSLTLAGLFPLSMEVESFAIARAIFSKETEPVLVIDFGKHRTSFFVFSGSLVRLTSTSACSADVLTLALARVLKISEQKAQKLKESEGLLKEKRGAEALVPVLNELTSQIKDYLSYYKSHLSKNNLDVTKDSDIKKVVLCGGGANLKGLPDFLSTQLGLKVELADALSNTNKEEQKKAIKISQEKSLSLATAIGLSQKIYDQH